MGAHVAIQQPKFIRRSASTIGGATWEEIGDRLGVTPMRAHQIFIRAIGKLKRRNPAALKVLREMAEQLEEQRTERARVKARAVSKMKEGI